MEQGDIENEQEAHRPLVMTLLSGLYLFFFMVTVSSYGQPIPFFGAIYQDTPAAVLVLFDSLFCLYLFLGLLKRQQLTWFLLLGYNTFESVNTLTNVLVITPAELGKFTGEKIDGNALLATNIAVIAGILVLSAVISRQRNHFTNRSIYLF